MSLDSSRMVEILQFEKVRFCMGIQIRHSVVFVTRLWITLTNYLSWPISGP